MMMNIWLVMAGYIVVWGGLAVLGAHLQIKMDEWSARRAERKRWELIGQAQESHWALEDYLKRLEDKYKGE